MRQNRPYLCRQWELPSRNGLVTNNFTNHSANIRNLMGIELFEDLTNWISIPTKKVELNKLL